MVLAVEIGLVDGEAVDEQLGLAGLAQQQAEIGGETVGIGGGDALGHTPVDIVALELAEQHSRAAVQELAKPDEVPRSQIFRACLHRHGLSSSRCRAIPDSGTTSSAPPARTSSPGMPHTTALSSASAMVRPPLDAAPSWRSRRHCPSRSSGCRSTVRQARAPWR